MTEQEVDKIIISNLEFSEENNLQRLEVNRLVWLIDLVIRLESLLARRLKK